MDKVEIFCTDCKAVHKSESSSCNNCGSEKRTIHIIIKDEVRLYDQVRIKSKGKIENKKLSQEQINGHEFSANGNIVHKIRLIDNVSDVYFEEIKDLDGIVIHKCQEKLSKHRGHGYAKKKKAE
ncbi:MAG: hypothetical protein LH619_04855 [Chitinophagaceae bacterium]|nr:hypothetical protein [Chitinophagaceae bacterium]